MQILKSLFFWTLLSLLASYNQVDCQCYDLIKQYYECKYLTMTLTNDSLGQADYRPDESIKNNKLTDNFYKRRDLGRVSFNEAMDLFRRIYTETENCSSEFCQCVSFKHIDRYQNYSVLFRNETTFPQFKKILKSHIDKFKSKIRPFRDVQYMWVDYPYSEKQLLTLAKFCYNFDYSWTRISLYDNPYCYKPFSYQAYYDCEWSVNVVNKTLSMNYTDSQKESLLVCGLIGQCNLERYDTLLTWVSKFPELNWHGRSLGSFLDNIIKRRSNFKPTIEFRSAYIYSFADQISLMTFDDKWAIEYSNSSSYSRNCFNSPRLNIDCEWSYESNETSGLARLDFKFTDDSLSVSIAINFSSDWLNFEKFQENGTLHKDKNGENWVQLFWYESWKWGAIEIYDFKSNSHFTIYRDSVNIMASPEFLENGSGILVAGFNSSQPLDSRRTIDCGKVCDHVSSRVGLKASSARVSYNECQRKCSLNY